MKLVLLLGFRFGVSAIIWEACWIYRDGDINEKMQKLQYSVNEEGSNREYYSKKLARYVNMSMIQGIFRNLECTVGYHASAGLIGDQLFPVVWEATRVLESIGF